jgi:CheY-like chemotaxis protein
MKSVLVVENDSQLRGFIRRVLASRHTLLEASSPVEALDICRNHPEVDLMVCDMDIGLVSGLELTSLLHAWMPTLRTVITCDLLRDYWTEGQVAELNEIPSEEVFVLEKPFTSEQLTAALDALMEEEVIATR